MTGNLRVPGFMNAHAPNEEGFSNLVRNLVLCAAVSPQFPVQYDVVLVPNPERVLSSGKDHAAGNFEQAPLDVWQVDYRVTHATAQQL